MKVHLSFDIEVWCRNWSGLDAQFPTAFDRYATGRSVAGDYALPKTLEILQRHGLVGVFFVEPLFSARFGAQWLQRLVDPILAAGQDVQLHLHPEWTDEIRPPLLADVSKKRQHLTYYSFEEQTTLIGVGRGLLEAAKGGPVQVFRAGSFAANRNTYRALAALGLRVDSSLNACYDLAQGSLDDVSRSVGRTAVEGVEVYPVTVFRDGFGRLRPAQVNGCSFGELRAALLAAQAAGAEHFVIVSHNFEMLRPDSAEPDWTVVRRFESLCQLLSELRDVAPTVPFPQAGNGNTLATPLGGPVSIPLGLTARRHVEQALRRLR